MVHVSYSEREYLHPKILGGADHFSLCICPQGKLSETEFEVVARRLGKNCRVAKLDSQKHYDVVNSLNVQGLPAAILIHKGRIVSKREGLVSRDQLMDFVDAFIPKQIC